MRARTALLLMVGVICMVGCESPEDGKPIGASEPPVPTQTVGKACDYGTGVSPALTLSAGPIRIKYDPATRQPSVSVNFNMIDLGFLKFGFEERFAPTAPGCYTIILTDSVNRLRYLIAIDDSEDFVFLHGVGEFTQLARQKFVEIETSRLCELRVFTNVMEVPTVSPECASDVTSFWVVQLGSFDNVDQARQHQQDLANRGIVDTSINTTEDWAVICPGYIVVWSRAFATRVALDEYVLRLPADIASDRFPRVASNDPTSRPVTCQPPP